MLHDSTIFRNGFDSLIFQNHTDRKVAQKIIRRWYFAVHMSTQALYFLRATKEVVVITWNKRRPDLTGWDE